MRAAVLAVLGLGAVCMVFGWSILAAASWADDFDEWDDEDEDDE